MIYKEFNNAYILQLEQHEELTREIKKFCTEKNILNASVSAIGAINSVTLGFYESSSQSYVQQSFHKPFELSCATGTILTDNGETVMHIHATISDKDFRTYGGHLFRAIVSKTIEVVIIPFV